MLCILHIHRFGLTGNQADKTFARFHGRHMHGFALQPFGCEEFKRIVGTHHIKGTHFGDHIGRNQGHDLIKACLSADRLRHDFAEAA